MNNKAIAHAFDSVKRLKQTVRRLDAAMQKLEPLVAHARIDKFDVQRSLNNCDANIEVGTHWLNKAIADILEVVPEDS
jgi:hypothetical protein